MNNKIIINDIKNYLFIPLYKNKRDFNSLASSLLAGHSKWHNIRYRKNRQDTARAAIFSKISKEISSAIKSK